MTGDFPRRIGADAAAAERLVELADALLAEGRLDEALEELELAAGAFGALRDIRAADCRVMLADVQLYLGMTEEAHVSLTAASAQYAAAGRMELVADCERRLGEVLVRAGAPEEGREHFEAAWAAYEGQDRVVDSAYAAMGVAWALWVAGQLEPALYVLDRVRPLVADDDALARARCDVLRGQLLLALGEAAEALAAVQPARETVAEAGDAESTVRADITSSGALREMGEFAAALTAASRARVLAVDAELSTALVTQSEMCQALALMDLGQLSAAREVLEGVHPRHDGTLGATSATLRLALGLVERESARPREAVRYLTPLVPSDGEEPSAVGASAALAATAADGLGLACADQGDFAAALAWHARAAEIRAGGAVDAGRSALGDVQRGATLLAADRPAEAAACFDAALKGFGGGGEVPGTIRAVAWLARAEAARERPEVARELLAGVASLVGPGTDPALRAALHHARGVVALAESKGPEALTELGAAIGLWADRSEILTFARAQVDLAEAWAVGGRHDAAELCAQRALDIFELGGLPVDAGRARSVLAGLRAGG